MGRGRPMKKREAVLFAVAIGLLAIGIVSYFTFQTSVPRVQPPVQPYT